MDKEKDDEFIEIKRREKVLFGEDHVWLRLEAEREEPSWIFVVVERVNKKGERMKKNVAK